MIPQRINPLLEQAPRVLRHHTNPLLNTHIRVIRHDDIKAPTVIRTEKTSHKRELIRLFRKQSAAEFVGTLTPGFHIFGLSKGQFDLVDVLEALSNQIGPAHLAISTWTIGKRNIVDIEKLIAGDRFPTTRWLLDCSFQRRHPEVIGHIRNSFGADSIVVTQNHCKFVTLANDNWKIVCRTSMNLNCNPRLEDCELKDDPHLYDFFEGFLKEIFAAHEKRRQHLQTKRQVKADFRAFVG